MRFSKGENPVKRSVFSFSILFCFITIAAHAQLSPQPDSIPQGQGWVQLNSGITDPLTYLSAVGRDTVFASGGAFLRSTDAGLSWASVLQAPVHWRILFLNSTTGFVYASGDTIYKTVNGGETWRAIPTGMGPGRAGPLAFATLDSGWIVALGTISRTTDGGETWQAHDISMLPTSMTFSDSKHGFVMGQVAPDPHKPPAAQYEYTINGKDWNQRYSGLPRDVLGLTAISSNKIIAVGDRLIAISSDTGASWDTIPVTEFEGYINVSFPDSFHGTIVGTHGAILHTTDGGYTWVRQNSGVTIDLFGIAFTDSVTGYTSGDNGIILKTINGGLSWVKLSPGIPTLQVQVYPLPANNTASLSYSLPQSQHVSLTLQAITGKQVSSILDGEMQTAGPHVVTFDVSRLAAGTYFLILRGENVICSGKVIVEHDLQ